MFQASRLSPFTAAASATALISVVSLAQIVDILSDGDARLEVSGLCRSFCDPFNCVGS